MFGPFSAQFANAVQQNYLERAFQEALLSNLAYRTISQKENFPSRIGEDLTKTRVGLMVPNTTPLNPSTNTNIDNGLTPQQYGTEQYTLSVAQYPQVAPIINLMDDWVSIESFLMQNSYNLGVACATAVDRLARAAAFNAYMSGNTVVTQTLGAPGTTVSVDDTRGFQTVSVNGKVTPVSPSNPLPILINGVAANVVGFANDSVNISSAAITGGTSGTITTAANVLVVNGTAGNSVIGVYAPFIVRPNGRTATSDLTSTDLLTVKTLRASVAYLANNGVPMIGGAYNCYLNQTAIDELYEDSEFQLIQSTRGTGDPNYANGWISNKFQRLRFIETTETYIQPPQLAAPVPVSETIQRTLICGAGTLVEGIFSRGISAVETMAAANSPGQMQQFKMPSVNAFGGNAGRYSSQGMYMYLRGPIDQLAQIVNQTANYVGGFVVPTDVTTTPAIIPTAGNAYYKRAVIIESV